ncbi:16S rRNA (uracil(1498)-N(3))-methyltransferase [Aliikangiella maris]|uniref:16S rRNA (Uracil(1498)-N(3))-methyltransferase n=2 Tax=Aliikangiella maris TaxID=3162458 RepID=A0ABV3MME4_9GAMM
MRYHRFYTSDKLSPGNNYQLPKEVAHHCIQVLRYAVNAQLVLFNGDGADYLAKITEINGKQCHVIVEDKTVIDNESPIYIHLLQGIARGEKMDLIIQKAVELGVNEITPIFTERCNVKLDAKRLPKKLAHWQSVVISACEQSQRAVIPKINPPSNIKTLIGTDKIMSLYLDPGAEHSINHLLKQYSKNDKLNIVIGPEGGFSLNDINHLVDIGATPALIGPRVLRTETAGLACIAVVQSTIGDF